MSSDLHKRGLFALISVALLAVYSLALEALLIPDFGGTSKKGELPAWVYETRTVKDDQPAVPTVLYEPVGLCSSLSSITPVIYTLPSRNDARRFARMYIARTTGGSLKPVFITGVLPQSATKGGPIVNRKLYAEAEAAGDIVITNFTESYTNLPFKTMATINWFAKCSNDRAIWLVKHDSDVLVNWPSFIRSLNEMATSGNYSGTTGRSLDAIVDPIMLGHVWTRMMIEHSLDNKNYEDLAGVFYPPYCSGPFYAMNRKMAELLVEQRHSMNRRFRNEDAMLGVLLNSTSYKPFQRREVIPYNLPEFLFPTCGGDPDRRSIRGCDCNAWWSYLPAQDLNVAVELVKNCTGADF